MAQKKLNEKEKEKVWRFLSCGGFLKEAKMKTFTFQFTFPETLQLQGTHKRIFETFESFSITATEGWHSGNLFSLWGFSGKKLHLLYRGFLKFAHTGFFPWKVKSFQTHGVIVKQRCSRHVEENWEDTFVFYCSRQLEIYGV